MIENTILIVDDDSDDKLLLETAFQETGFKGKIIFFNNGIELLKSLMEENSSPPKLILLDLNMPKKDGRESLREIKSHPNLKKIPVVIFTTTRNQSEIQLCYNLGANTYIVKPDSYGNLLKVVTGIKDYWFEIASN